VPSIRIDELAVTINDKVAVVTTQARARVEEDRKGKTAMTTQVETATAPEPDHAVKKKIQQLRELYADAPELGRVALENGLSDLERELAAATRADSAGRVGARQGRVSEFTLILPFADGGAARLRGLLQLLQGNFQLADRVGTVHDMRFVFLDNDTKLLFATAYDGEWDPYIEDFATKIPNALDLLLCNCKGFPGIRSPQVKDWLASHQIAAESWYVANPDLTVADTRRLKRVGAAVDEFLDKVGN
jgi:hypothetical protein